MTKKSSYRSAYSAPCCEFSQQLPFAIICDSASGDNEDFTDNPEFNW